MIPIARMNTESRSSISENARREDARSENARSENARSEDARRLVRTFVTWR
jgi:hypothetical protein